MSSAEKIYSRLVDRNEAAEAKLPEEVRRNVAPNGVRLVAAQALQSSGDQTVNASTVLPWLFHALGVPVGLTGLLVPIRESGSMLPQAFLTPLVIRVRRRALVFAAGALVQAASVAAMALVAAVGSGLGAGVAILVALAVFSLGRCLTSISSKDVQGRTLPKGERGQINGISTTISGLVAITLGVALRVFGGEDLQASQLALILAGGAVAWVLVALIYRGVREPAPVGAESDGGDRGDRGDRGDEGGRSWFRDTLALLREDAQFRRFVTVRSFLLVSALSPPFIVTLSVSSGSGSLGGLGAFVLASGVASLVGGGLFGKQADRSSRDLMMRTAGAASLVLVALMVVVLLPGFDGTSLLGTVVFVGAYFLITLLHKGVRLGRKTYVVDMAEGDQRTTYTAVSNTAMGVVLLVVGAISSALALIHVLVALAFLALLGVLAVLGSRGLPDVSAGA